MLSIPNYKNLSGQKIKIDLEPGYIYNTSDGIGSSILQNDLKNMTLVKSKRFNAGLGFKFSELMNGYKIRLKIYGTYLTNKTAFKSWNFDGYQNFMDYYESKHNINILSTPYYING